VIWHCLPGHPNGAEVPGRVPPAPIFRIWSTPTAWWTRRVTEAKEEKKKDDITHAVAGASSPAKTPLAGPVFIFEADKLSANKIQLYKFEVKNGLARSGFPTRQALVTTAAPTSRPGGNLYKIEVDEAWKTEYGLTPEDSIRCSAFRFSSAVQ
jgi:hypothetical protein